VYDALKAEVARRGLVTDTWVTKTFCLGVCPKEGATVARYAPSAPAIFADVVPEDAPALLDLPEDADPIERELLALEELHTKKVLDLARRLKPGLTLEDVRNPHDFPELDDPDWHYADGMLSGIKAARVTVRATRNRNG
jgi:(2Fe-2S) ferredoxin